MKIKILCLGKSKSGYIKEGVKEYLKRISAFTNIELIELPDVKLTSTINIDIVKEKEAVIIEKYFDNRSFLIVLDENGKQLDSIKFSNFISGITHNEIIFVIGGVYGISEKILERADLRLSFSKMTFTHQMIRLILIEQIYRAFTIRSGKKYHY